MLKLILNLDFKIFREVSIKYYFPSILLLILLYIGIIFNFTQFLNKFKLLNL